MRVVSLLAISGLLIISSVAVAQKSRYEQPSRNTLPPPGGAVQNLAVPHTLAPGDASRPSVEEQNRGLLEELDNGSRTASELLSQPPATMREPSRGYGRAVTPPPTMRAQAVDSTYAEQLMKATLTAKTGSQLAGSPIRLADVVQTARSRQDQSQRINAYWDLCSSVADYYLSLHEQAEIERLAARSPQLTTPLRAAILKLKTRRDTSLTAARATQYRLGALMQSDPGSLPLPNDMPHCGTYRTRYSETFSGRSSREAAELDELLPLRHAELVDAALAVKASEEWFGQIVSRAGDAQAAEGVVRALELLALNRRAFVQISRDYNRRITRYTELARPGQVGSQRLVAMLIKTNQRRATATRDSRSGLLPGRSSQSIPPETFREDWRNPPKDVAPRLDQEVIPAGNEVTESFVEKVTPGETSVLENKPEE
ncbi:MAG: hypothetical protein ACR2NU_10085 [Aeoliella sp.]